MAQTFTPPSMDWEDDSLVYHRLQKFQRDANEKFKGPLNREKNEVKANYLLGWIPDDVKDYLYSLRDEYKDPQDIWNALKDKYKMKVNELSSFNRLRTLTQGNMTLDQFITTARKLVSDCKYPNDGERLLRDIIVSGVNSKSAYTKCVDKGKDLTYEEAVRIVRNEEEVRRQVEFTCPEFRHNTHTEPPSPGTSVHQLNQREEEDRFSSYSSESVHKINLRNKSPKRHNPRQNPNHYNSNTQGCQYCGQHRTHPRDQCPASGKECHNCGKKGHFTRACRSKHSPRRRDNQNTRLDTLEKAIKRLTATVHYKASPPSSPTKEMVDCIAKDYTDIHFEDTKTVYKLQTTTNNLKAQQPTAPQTHNSEQIRPIWISEKPDSKITQSICEVDTGAGCNVISTSQAKDLFQTE